MTLWVDRCTPELEDAHWMLAQMEVLLEVQRKGGIQLGEEGYLTHPKDGFDRAITMSAWVDHPTTSSGVLGAKWVSSRVANLPDLPRGRSITMLNDGSTGLPVLCFDGTDLSNARTAIFACAAIARLISPWGRWGGTVGLLGAGRVHEWQAIYMHQLWPGIHLTVFDPDTKRAAEFAKLFGADIALNWQEAIEGADVVSCATAGAEPGWVPDDLVFTADMWINTSLRDVESHFFSRFPLVVVDDLELAMQQRTPFHRA
ncbi:hypothetical protein LCGC14_3148750, partial [marine sediment metagenome]